MATVYKAYDTRLETDVAVKVIRTENLAPSVLERSLKRFEREAKALARLTHPNIVKVTDYGEYEGKPYLVMEYLPGGTLKQKLGKPIPWNEAITILLPIARALDFAHRQNMIHRDVKPSNILITADGEPMLTDFGIAKILDLEETQDLTGTSAAVGTPEYMAPEQVTAKTVDHRADIYALGVVLYEAVTGRKPFIADTPMAVLIKHATESLPRPSQFAVNLPEAVEKLLIKAMAKKPDDRYQTMNEMAAAWQSALESKGQIQAPAEKSNPDIEQGRRKKRLETTTIEETRDSADYEETLGTVVQSMFEEEEIKKPRVTKSEKVDKNQRIITLAPGVKMAFMRVPAGQFLMGCPEEIGYYDERPQHNVYLDDYWMGKTPVTNLQFQTFIKATGQLPPAHWERTIIPAGKAQHPVTYVSWQDAQAFCDWISQVSGKRIRLPTEAEWEKAARGTDGRTYPWGNQKPNHQLCNYWKFFSTGTTPIGQFSPQGDSPYGCVDMAGNVWEWIADWYSASYYNNSPPQNPLGPSKGSSRVLRGGSWSNDGNSLRTSQRCVDIPSSFDDFIGFRCILLS
jgi:serine/threonine-protein kinase